MGRFGRGVVRGDGEEGGGVVGEMRLVSDDVDADEADAGDVDVDDVLHLIARGGDVCGGLRQELEGEALLHVRCVGGGAEMDEGERCLEDEHAYNVPFEEFRPLWGEEEEDNEGEEEELEEDEVADHDAIMEAACIAAPCCITQVLCALGTGVQQGVQLGRGGGEGGGGKRKAAQAVRHGFERLYLLMQCLVWMMIAFITLRNRVLGGYN